MKRLAKKIMTALCEDNGCAVSFPKENVREIAEALDGFGKKEFTDEEIEILVAGEETEMEAAFSGISGWKKLNESINDYFNTL